MDGWGHGEVSEVTEEWTQEKQSGIRKSIAAIFFF